MQVTVQNDLMYSIFLLFLVVTQTIIGINFQKLMMSKDNPPVNFFGFAFKQHLVLIKAFKMPLRTYIGDLCLVRYSFTWV